MLSLERLWIACLGGISSSLAQACCYLVCAGVASAVAYGWARAYLRRNPIPTKPQSGRQTRWEIACSIRTLLIFGVVAGCTAFAAFSGWTLLYWRIYDYGWVWFFLSVPLLIVLHDAYFYWTHRLMHERRLFRHVHRVHHLSVSPSPWATYSCNVWEAFILAGILPLFVFTLPLHPRAVLLWMSWQVAFSVLTHYRYEVLPGWLLQTWPGRLLISPTYHALHHESFRVNFGLYFSFWDRLMGTDHKGYAERFEQATSVGAHLE